MNFENPFWGLLGILGAFIWSAYNSNTGRALAIPLNYNQNVLINIQRKSVWFLGMVSWALISFSLMGPKESYTGRNKNIWANSLYFVLDVSRSMLATDFSPNRLNVAKEKIKEFISLKPTDQMGLILFSEEIVTLIPLTTDFELISEGLKHVNVGPLGSGTNIGDALGLAITRAEKSPARHKVVILLTDGVSQVDTLDPIGAAKIAREKNIIVHTIGMGTDDNALLPMGGRNGVMTYQKIPGGSIDLETLEEISNITGGNFYRANTSESLRNVFKDISVLEKSRVQIKNRQDYHRNFYIYLLYGVLGLFLIESFRLLCREFS